MSSTRGRSRLVFVAAALLGACGGSESHGPRDSGAAARDAGPARDVGPAGDAGPIDPTCARVQAVLDRWIAESATPGVAASVALADGTSCALAAGASNLDAATPMRPGDRFRIGSVTKTFTAALIMLLVEDGMLSLDDTVADHLTGVPNGDMVTVRMLLQHASGLGDYLFTDAIQSTRDAPHTGDELLEVIRSVAPVHAPGTVVDYSNTNYVVLGLIAERVGGATWASQVRARILDPLALADTFVYGWEDVAGGFAHGYTADGAGGWTDVTMGMHPTNAHAAGAMVSSMPDLVRWSEALHEGRVVAPATVATMKSDARVWDANPGIRIGLGLFITDVDGFVTGFGHAGGIDGFQTEMQFLDGPGHHVAVVINNNGRTTRGADVLLNDTWIAVLDLSP